MPWERDIFPLLIIVSGEPHTGLFVYNGAPAKGSLVFAVTAPGVTSDPVGNSIPSSGVLNAGTWNASGVLTSHFGINNAGDTFLANSAGLTVVHEASADGSIRFYNASGEGVGNLIASIAPATGTDGPGNIYLAGPTSYGAVAGHPTAVQLLTNTLSYYIAATAAGPYVLGASIAPTVVGSAINGLSLTAGSDSYVLTNTGGLLMPNQASLPGGTSGSSTLVSDTNGFERMVPGLTGDTNAYQLGEIILTTGGFTINSTTPQTILSCPVGIGTYVVEVWFVTSNTTAADAAGWALTGPAASVQTVAFESKITGAPPTVIADYGASSTYTTTFNSQGTGGNQDVMMRALVSFSAAGTLAITGKELVAANTVTIFGGWMRVRHVS